MCDVREDEVPSEMWAFGKWVEVYAASHKLRTWGEWMLHFEIIAAEAQRYGLIIHEDGVIEYRKH